MSTNILDYIKPTGGQDRRDINKILEMLTDFTANPSENQGYHERIALSPELRTRVSGTTFGTPSWTKNQAKNHAIPTLRYQVPPSPKTDPLTRTYNGTWTYPQTGTKFGCATELTGTQYITIANHTSMNTVNFSILGWIMIRSATAGQYIATKINGGWSDGWRLFVNNSKQLEFDSKNGGGSELINLTSPVMSVDTWYHYAVTYTNSTTTSRMYLNASEVANSPITSGNARNDATNTLGIFGDHLGNSKITARAGMFTFINSAVTSTFITNHMNGFLDFSTDNKVEYIPFCGDNRSMPDAVTNISHT